ncbi:hypothetical protein AXE80_03490 [Wenyingzhuangia fucanilytica]|uniref:Uncharacterized protein n=1 Tax=Wenyingzhuangia fucanilytica TaxID=1790137 RepID=A0A1B1Y3S6_9FLAO|nr:hypothetical protein [Wenyingzhuangia fucanilytica]ANW95397.1 hypothetical protein AXE80_03490 [Wenyingzhuangia fucanilytica]
MSENEDKTLINFFLWFFGIFAVWMLGYIIIKAFNHNELSVFNMIIPITIGVTYENLKISNNWKHTTLKIFAALVVSLMAFIETENHEDFSFSDNIHEWSYAFIFLLVTASVIYHKDSVIPKITEGIILLQSISFVYWIINIYKENIFNQYVLIALIVPFFLFSIFHAFSYKKFSQNNKLILSVWSSFIMLIFSIKTMMKTINNESYLDTSFEGVLINYLIYFILGVSLVYIFKNAEMFIGYIPNKDNGYDNYSEKVNRLNKKHIARFTEIQVNKSDSLLAILFLSVIYSLNYVYNFIDSETLIWLCFILFPYILNLKNYLIQKR